MNSTTPSPAHPSAVTVLVTRRARPEQAAAFEQATESMMTAARNFPGHLGGYLVKPSEEPDTERGVYHSVFAFDTEAHLAAWQQSEERARCLQALAAHTETESGYRRMPGLEHWFGVNSTRRAPPRWKVASITWLGICPTVWLAQTLLAPPLAHWPSFPRVMVMTAVIVVLMTWWVAPTLTRLFASWLYGSPPSSKS